jgi:elongation factor Ts
VSTVTAGQVKELRERTGAGMMDCKRALVDTGGDIEEAIKLIREKGLAQAAKRAGRETTEGKVIYDLSRETVAAMVAVGCETEPVSNNREFMIFAQSVLDVVEKHGPEAAQELEEQRTDLIAKLGENIVVRDAVRYEAGERELLTAYVHPPANKIGVLLHARADDRGEKEEGEADQAYRVAMHIAASNPLYVSRSDVPEAEIEAERDVLSKQPDVQEKPEEVRGKIVEGRIQKWLAEIVLEEQPWIYETSKKVGQVLDEAGLEVIEFKRLAVAE